ncbi:MAG: alpha/beta fold hydrolase [Planctomycetes bacterium]|nr:alpha/beta fold hydrolase [Planctomycetota bacterium]
MLKPLQHREFGSGRPLVLVHGFPFHGEQWDAVARELASVARCLVPDLRGFGRSAWPAQSAPDVWTMEQHAEDLAEWLDHLRVDEPLVLAGFSMGGYVAWPFLRAHRERLRGLALCNTRAIADTTEGAAGRAKLAARALLEGAAPVIEGMLPKLLAPHTLAARPEVVSAVRRLMEVAAPNALAAALHGMARRPDSTPLLGSLDVPTLVVVGEHDAISSVAEMRGIATAIRGARLVEIANAGHMTTHENPAALARALREFITSLA